MTSLDELPRARQRPLSPPTSFIRAPGIADVEDAGVGGVGQVEADDLPSCASSVARLAVDEQDVAEPAHRRVGRLRPAERRDLAVLDEDVVEREQRARG